MKYYVKIFLLALLLALAFSLIVVKGEDRTPSLVPTRPVVLNSRACPC